MIETSGLFNQLIDQKLISSEKKFGEKNLKSSKKNQNTKICGVVMLIWNRFMQKINNGTHLSMVSCKDTKTASTSAVVEFLLSLNIYLASLAPNKLPTGFF